ncbi:MAG: helix-turn-helix domain-containing protein [Leptolyngbyaceae cyanobacterium SM2_5_2]|nr:helix-turn-helix domain-containing protein [Leptolyngbyaceae cyanobacterium SM2_5_2]
MNKALFVAKAHVISTRGFFASPEGLKQLQAAKAERGWTFAAIAQQAGVSADTVSRLFHPSG